MNFYDKNVVNYMSAIFYILSQVLGSNQPQLADDPGDASNEQETKRGCSLCLMKKNYQDQNKAGG